MRKTILAAGLLALAAALPLHAAISYTAVTKAEGQRGAEMADTTIKAWFDGTSARMEFKDSQNPMMPKGTYMLTTDAGASFVLVNPEQKTYARWSLDEMMGMAGGAMKMARGLVKMKFSQPKVEKLLEEPGAPILGLATTHYRFRTSYAMEMSIFGRTTKTSTVTEEDIWATSGLDELVQKVWSKWQAPSTGDEDLDRLVKAEKEKAQGTPLRRITVTTSDDGSGKKTTTKTTMEVTDLDRSAIAPPGAFAVPPGYEEVDMLGVAMPGMER